MRTLKTWKMLAKTRRVLKHVITNEMYSRLGEMLDNLYGKWNLVG